MTDHSVLAPSSANIRAQCPGSRALMALYPPQETEKTREGTLAHSVLASVLRGEGLPDGADSEMIDGAVMVADWIYSRPGFAVDAVPKPELRIEKRVDSSIIHPQSWGTCDVWFYDFHAGELVVIDYKYGHQEVPAYNNWQLIEYALGIIHTDFIAHESTFNVRMVVIQPRCFTTSPVREWEVTATFLKQQLLTEAKSFEHASMQPNAVCITGSECANCSARHVCDTLQKNTLRWVHTAWEQQSTELADNVIAKQYELLVEVESLIKARKSGLQDEMLNRLSNGGTIPFWGVNRVKSRERWKTDSVDEVLTVAELMGVDVTKPQEKALITPNQAIKLGLPREVVSQYTETPLGELKLVKVTTEGL